MEAIAGKTVLVTGGGQGLGAAICRELAGAGAEVVIADIEETRARMLAGQLSALGATVMPLRLDVGDSASVSRGMDKIVSRFGGLDVLINNAGTDVTLPLEELQEQQWERVLRTNLHGPFLLAKAALPHMQRSALPHIVNICSTAARRCWPNASAYHASKWGLLGFSHALHAELRPAGIKVTAVIAGGMRTPFLLDRFPDLDPGVLQDPENVARTVLFVLGLPAESVIPEVMVLPMRESSWP